MGQWTVNKLKSAKESVEDAKESLSGLGMHSAIERLDYILDYINDELKAESYSTSQAVTNGRI